MKSFQIKAHLLAGLTYRIAKLDEQKVCDTLCASFSGKPSSAIRANLKLVTKLNEQNGTFMAATKEVFDKKTAVFTEMKKKYDEETVGKSAEEAALIAQRLRAENDAAFAEIQQASTSKPEEMVTVTVSDDEYEKVLLPIFERTVGTWDDGGEGLGQKFFAEVADSIEHVTEA